MQHWGLKHIVYINDDLKLKTYFTARLNLVTYVFEWGKLVQSHLMGKNLQKMTKLTDDIKQISSKIFDPMAPSVPVRGYKHAYTFICKNLLL